LGDRPLICQARPERLTCTRREFLKLGELLPEKREHSMVEFADVGETARRMQLRECTLCIAANSGGFGLHVGSGIAAARQGKGDRNRQSRQTDRQCPAEWCPGHGVISERRPST
jgi:hypothetical protein